DDDELVARGLAGRDRAADRRGKLTAGLARGERAHEGAAAMDRVHADAIAEERAAGLATRRINRQHRDAELRSLVEAETTHQLVGERALAGTARARDAEYRRLPRCQLAGECA